MLLYLLHMSVGSIEMEQRLGQLDVLLSHRVIERCATPSILQREIDAAFHRKVVHYVLVADARGKVDYLAMKRCVNLALKDRWGGTALDDAVREKHTQLAETLFHFYRANGHVEEIEQHMDLLKVVSEVKDEEDGKGSSSKGWFNLSA